MSSYQVWHWQTLNRHAVYQCNVVSILTPTVYPKSEKTGTTFTMQIKNYTGNLIFQTSFLAGVLVDSMNLIYFMFFCFSSVSFHLVKYIHFCISTFQHSLNKVVTIKLLWLRNFVICLHSTQRWSGIKDINWWGSVFIALSHSPWIHILRCAAVLGSSHISLVLNLHILYWLHLSLLIKVVDATFHHYITINCLK